MKKQLQKFFAKKNNKGFTLIELIIVIAILAILIGIVGMASIRYVEKSRKAADEQTLDSIGTAAQAVFVDPANGVTFSGTTSPITATITVKPTTSTVAADKGKFEIEVPTTITSSTGVDLAQEITDSLAKAPALKSQSYKNGADCTITVTLDATTKAVKDIKFGGWEAK